MLDEYFLNLWLQTIRRCWTIDFVYSYFDEPLESYITVKWFVCIFATAAAHSIHLVHAGRYTLSSFYGGGRNKHPYLHHRHRRRSRNDESSALQIYESGALSRTIELVADVSTVKLKITPTTVRILIVRRLEDDSRGKIANTAIINPVTIIIHNLHQRIPTTPNNFNNIYQREPTVPNNINLHQQLSNPFYKNLTSLSIIKIYNNTPLQLFQITTNR